MLKPFILAGTFLACLTFNSTAGVQTTTFDPPLSINAFADIVPADQPFNILPIDFNLDGNVDFTLAYGLGGMGAYFNSPTRVIAYAPMGILIGANLNRPGAYQWWAGYANNYDLTLPFGDHEIGLVTANVIPNGGGAETGLNGSILTVFGPVLPPQIPVVSGPVAGKEGVMAVEFMINGELHYGYIHFDFRSKSTTFGGAGGLIYGWAYETEPGVPIFAAPLGDKFDRDHEGNQRH